MNKRYRITKDTMVYYTDDDANPGFAHALITEREVVYSEEDKYFYPQESPVDVDNYYYFNLPSNNRNIYVIAVPIDKVEIVAVDRSPRLGGFGPWQPPGH